MITYGTILPDTINYNYQVIDFLNQRMRAVHNAASFVIGRRRIYKEELSN